MAVGVASFSYAAVGTETKQGWNYYDSFARVWELLVGAGLALLTGLVVPSRRMRPTVFAAPAELPPPTVDGCIADWDTRDVVTCTYGAADADRTIAVVGSSHAEHWVPALQVIAEQERFRISVHLEMGCPLTLPDDVGYKGEQNPDCRDWSREVIGLLGEQRPDWVFTIGTRPIDSGGNELPGR
ncbi:SGNH hydrolase domain-containing protein [Nocardia cyriacigeorgica]|uniref:SGNH hydrolase domain-containing protein n=1 Tax=Nocardia cyriacigeorgica TaxID=135487 RepID=UPI002456EA3F|nr:SGNH hydrolase domain-containing protein [Nocardia cyriacigeorgica]